MEVMAGCRVAHGLIGLRRLLDLAGEIDLVLKVGGRDFRAILLGDQKPNLVRKPINHLVLLGGGAVEEIDQAPAQILDVALERAKGEKREKIAPDSADGLFHRFGGRRRL